MGAPFFQSALVKVEIVEIAHRLRRVAKNDTM